MVTKRTERHKTKIFLDYIAVRRRSRRVREEPSSTGRGPVTDNKFEQMATKMRRRRYLNPDCGGWVCFRDIVSECRFYFFDEQSKFVLFSFFAGCCFSR